jgi:hypothetical protein
MKVRSFILISMVMLFLTSCELPRTERRLFTDVDEARQFHRACLAKGKVVHVEEAATGIEIRCY